MKKNNYYIGLVSGTSMDGVDGVVLDNHQKIITTAYAPYPKALKTRLQRLVQSGQSTLANLAQTDIDVAQIFAKTAIQLLKQSALSKNDVRAIGSHGQTIYHQGRAYSMQIGHGALIAGHTRITTVSDFRMQDVAALGQGAPLTPIYHQYMLNGKDGVIVNLGGIANITIVRNNQVFGFDTGPANTLLDAWIKQNKYLDYDRDGMWARSGIINKALLKTMLDDKYFQQQYPKSTGQEYFNLDWLSKHLKGTEAPEDVQRTLIELTVMSISASIPTGATVYLCGGGVHNLFLRERLSYQNFDNEITTTDDLGVPIDYVEAAAFAYFAKQTIAGKPSNLPSVTGAKHKTILGAVHAI